MQGSPDYDIEGVTFDSARDWLQGKFSVGNSIVDSPLDRSRCEIVFANELGSRADYRAAVAHVKQLAAQGAKGFVAHALGNVMVARYRRQGCLVVRTDEIIWRGTPYTAARMLARPEAFRAWIDRMPTSLVKL